MILENFPPQNELELLGQEMRKQAFLDRCFIPQDGFDPRFYRKIGEDYSVAVMLEMFPMGKKAIPPPRWHASICMLHEIGSGNEFGMPDQAILIMDQWSADAHKIAREILGYLLGPVILREDQVVQDVDDRCSKHWFTRAFLDGRNSSDNSD